MSRVCVQAGIDLAMPKRLSYLSQTFQTWPHISAAFMKYDARSAKHELQVMSLTYNKLACDSNDDE